MPKREEAIAELYRRGALSGHQKEAAEELMRRGTIPMVQGAKDYAGPSKDARIEPMSKWEAFKVFKGQPFAEKSRPVVTTTGQIGGTALGAVASPFAGPAAPAMPIAGGIAGYTGAATLQDFLDEAVGLKPKPDSRLLSTLGHAGTGALNEALGYAGSKVIPILPKAAKVLTGNAESKGIRQTMKDIAMSPLEKAAPTLKKWSRTQAESAMKIPPSIPDDVRNKAITEMMEGKYPVSEKGLADLRKDIDGLNKQIASTIGDSKHSWKRVDIDKVLSSLESLKSFYKNTPYPTPYVKEIEQISKEVRKFQGASIPIEKAQKMKQTIYALERKHYGEMKNLQVEANKSIARGLKDEIVDKIPQLKELNARDSAKINLESLLERAVNRTRNYDVIRLGDVIATTTGAAAGGPGGAAVAGILKRISEDPVFKSHLAFALNKVAKIGTKQEAERLAGEIIKSASLSYSQKLAVKGGVTAYKETVKSDAQKKDRKKWKEIGGDNE